MRIAVKQLYISGLRRSRSWKQTVVAVKAAIASLARTQKNLATGLLSLAPAELHRHSDISFCAYRNTVSASSLRQ